MTNESPLLLSALFFGAAAFALPLHAQSVSGTSPAPAANSQASSLPAWAIGPFSRQTNPEPVLRPNPDSTFENPINHEIVHWEKGQVYNPAAAVCDGKIVVLYRAQQGPGNTCSRVGYAESADGFHFTCDLAPVFYPAPDDQQNFEWSGTETRRGCEDPRLAQAPDGSYRMTYAQNSNAISSPGIASSTDLRHWTKLGNAFVGTKWERTRTKSAAILHEVKDGRLVAVKIKGSYWMYFGEHAVSVATSDDLTHWKPLEGPDGKLLIIMTPRNGFFDSLLTEVGSQAVLTRDGIVVFYNGTNARGAAGDSTLRPGVYSGGQALFDVNDPTHLITRLDKPFITPSYPWEQTGLYRSGTTFIEGLALFHNQWFVYFGCADSFVGVATAPFKAEQAKHGT